MARVSSSVRTENILFAVCISCIHSRSDGFNGGRRIESLVKVKCKNNQHQVHFLIKLCELSNNLYQFLKYNLQNICTWS